MHDTRPAEERSLAHSLALMVARMTVVVVKKAQIAVSEVGLDKNRYLLFPSIVLSRLN